MRGREARYAVTVMVMERDPGVPVAGKKVLFPDREQWRGKHASPAMCSHLLIGRSWSSALESPRPDMEIS